MSFTLLYIDLKHAKKQINVDNSVFNAIEIIVDPSDSSTPSQVSSFSDDVSPVEFPEKSGEDDERHEVDRPIPPKARYDAATAASSRTRGTLAKQQRAAPAPAVEEDSIDAGKLGV